jgi:hypothetical protein
MPVVDGSFVPFPCPALSRLKEQAKESALAEQRGEGNSAAVDSNMGVSDDVDKPTGPGNRSPAWMQHHRLLKEQGFSKPQFPLQAQQQIDRQ